MYESIAVIGTACRFAQAGDIEEFWQNIASGRDSVRDFPGSRIKELAESPGVPPEEEIARGGYLNTMSFFEPAYFNISEEECKYLDPQQRLLLELVEESIQSSGYNPVTLSAEKVGVFMATSINSYAMLSRSMPMGVANSSEAAAAGRVSYTFNFRGPALAINTESSSALVALHYACLSLQHGECDYAVTGASRIHVVPPGKQFIDQNMMTSSSQKIRAFDSKADGIIPGEGGGVLLLKRLNRALKDKDIIYAVIKGSAVNCNGSRSNGLSAPSQLAQAELMTRVNETSGLDPNTISYIEAHGTGTKIGDPIEIEGITATFSEYTDKTQFIPLGSVKTNIGHLGSASAIPGIIKVIMAFKNKKIPPSLHFQEPNPLIDFEHSPVYVNTRLKDWNSGGVKRAGINSLGLTGTNAYVILQEPPAVDFKEKKDRQNIFTLSAVTKDSLNKMIHRLNHYLKKHPDTAIDDAAYTLNTGRRDLVYRLALVANNRSQLMQTLDALEKQANHGDNVYGNWRDNHSFPRDIQFSPVFIYPDMEINHDFSFDSLCSEPLFRDHYTRCAGNTSPAAVKYFACQYSLSRLLTAVGLAPKAVLGVGIGKYAADVIKEKITPEDAVTSTREFTKKNEPIDKQKLQTVIRQMLNKKYNLFLYIGGENILGKEIANLLENRENVLYLQLDFNHGTLYSVLCKLYTCGFDPDWQAFYQGQDRQRLHLPAYPFDRKSYLLKPGKIEPKVEVPGIPRDQPPIEAIPGVHFNDIFSIFKSVIPNHLDLEEDYVDNNGSSISVMQIITLIKESYHVTLNIDLFYSSSTLQELIERILTQIRQGGESPAEEVAAREEDIEPAFELDPSKISPVKTKPENILLTGSSGYFGSQLLKDLIEQTDTHIYCIARGNTFPDARQHSLDMWNYYFKNQLESYLNRRIFLVKGDIARENIGIPGDRYKELSEIIDTVIHCAADVRHYGKYEHAEKVNTGGTRNIIDFCFNGKPKRLHHISTKAISEYPREAVVMKENNLDIGQVFRGRIYARSKFEAEKCVNRARVRGLNAAVYRIGDLTGRYTDGFFQKNVETNRYYNNIRALVLLKKIFSNALELMKLEVSPVDSCSQAVINLILLEDSVGYNFHIMNPKTVPLKKFCAALKNLGSPIEVVDPQTFSNYVDEELKSKGFVKELSWISYLLTLDEYASLPPVEIDSNFTVRVLKKTNFSWPDIEVEYIEKLIKHCIDVKYITL
jgi:thioester reductase-like protein